MTLWHSNTSSSQWQPLFQPRRKTATGPGAPLPYIPSLEELNVFLEHLEEMPIAKNPSLISSANSIPAFELTSFSVI